MKRLLLLAALLAAVAVSVAQPLPEMRIRTRCIWDNGKYCAFTSLVKFRGRYYCTFREGVSHIFDAQGRAEGQIRVVSSRNGRRWRSEALLGAEGLDFRDPKLSVTPDGRLMLSFGTSVYADRQLTARFPQVCFSTDGRTFSAPQRVGLDRPHGHDWLWRTTWHEGRGYTVNYFHTAAGADSAAVLVTTDGIHYRHHAAIPLGGRPNEATIRFLSDGRMVVALRREEGDQRGYLGIASAPFQEFDWKRTDLRLGGPDLLELPDGRLLLGTRNYATAVWQTSLYRSKWQADNPAFEEMAVLPSGGDTSYPSLLVVGKELWVSYYSSHQDGRARIYLARLPLKALQ